MTDLGAPAECEIHDVNPICVENGEGFGALGVCAPVCRVVAELEDMTDLLK